jgi:hypothetical protein
VSRQATGQVRDNPELARFEISVDDRLAGYAQYRRRSDRVAH